MCQSEHAFTMEFQAGEKDGGVVIGIPGDKDVRQKDNHEIVHKVAHPTVAHLTGGSLRGMQMAMRVQKSRPLQEGLGQEGRTGGEGFGSEGHQKVSKQTGKGEAGRRESGWA